MSVQRIMGTETEFGVHDRYFPAADPIKMSAQVVQAYQDLGRFGKPVGWDYQGENPLQDMRGFRVDRATADPSLLTDNPNFLAPSGPQPGGNRITSVERPVYERGDRVIPTSRMLSNAARWYVDHAHPEYSGPECRGPKTATLYDQAGDRIAQKALLEIRKNQPGFSLYKNNTDGKGASYGAHENYLVQREVPFNFLARVLTTFLVTRQVICGSGRVGIGEGVKPLRPGFQISQRADFMQSLLGLQTTFDRPIINTRDEAHADPAVFRRLHMIVGDANIFPYSTFLRLGSTAALLSVLEWGPDHPAVKRLHDFELVDDPVVAIKEISHDPTLKTKLLTKSGPLTAVQIQLGYCRVIGQALQNAALPGEIDAETKELLETWETVLLGLETDLGSVAGKVEWVAKYLFLSQLKERLPSKKWDDSQLQAFDLQWHDLDPTNGIQKTLVKAGFCESLFTPEQIEQATVQPPLWTRAGIRGRAVAVFDQVQSASWSSLVVDQGSEKLIRLSFTDPTQGITPAQRGALAVADLEAFIAASVTGNNSW